MTQHPIPLSMYVHLPWCIRKCPYCDFNSHAQKGELPEHKYIDALMQDFEQERKLLEHRPIRSIFFGGGTPSLFSAHAFDRLLKHVRNNATLASDCEITLEANPGTFEQEKFSAYREIGINRLSIGVQSFNANHLKRLGRIHDNHEALRAADIARQAGFDNFNLDLMFGLPEQSLDQALEDIRTAIECSPTHISHYQLTIEPNTQFHHQPPALPNDDDIGDMQDACEARLNDAGFERYEISALSKPHLASKHNLNYWQFGDYLGIGAGAHGKLTDADSMRITRTSKHKHPNKYLDTASSTDRIQEQHQLDDNEKIFEFMLNALRLQDGFNTTMFQARTGLNASILAASLEHAQHLGLMSYSAEHIRPTRTGHQFLNDLTALFLPNA